MISKSEQKDRLFLEARVTSSFTLACGCRAPRSDPDEATRPFETIGAGHLMHCSKHGDQRIVRITQFLESVGYAYSNDPRQPRGKGAK